MQRENELTATTPWVSLHCKYWNLGVRLYKSSMLPTHMLNHSSIHSLCANSNGISSCSSINTCNLYYMLWRCWVVKDCKSWRAALEEITVWWEIQTGWQIITTTREYRGMLLLHKKQALEHVKASSLSFSTFIIFTNVVLYIESLPGSQRSQWQPTLVCLPGEFRGQRSLGGYSPGGLKEFDMTERLTLYFSF